MIKLIVNGSITNHFSPSDTVKARLALQAATDYHTPKRSTTKRMESKTFMRSSEVANSNDIFLQYPA